MLFVVGSAAWLFITYAWEVALKDDDHRRPLVAGPMLNQLIHFKTMFDYQTSLAKKYKTYRFITPSHSEFYTSDPANVEHILKANFPNYVKVDSSVLG